MELAALERIKNSHRLTMGKCYLHSSLFIFDRIIVKVAGNQDRHKSLDEFDFRPDQTTHFGVTRPWVTKILHFWTWISLKPVGQSWSNFMCSIIWVGERLHKVLGQIDPGTLDSGEQSLPFGLLVLLCELSRFVVFYFTGNAIKVYRLWVPCGCRSSYSFALIVLKLCRCFLHGIKMCMWFWDYPWILFSLSFQNSVTNLSFSSDSPVMGL